MTPRKLTPAEALEYVRAYHVGGVANWAEVMDRDPEECIAALEEALARLAAMEAKPKPAAPHAMEPSCAKCGHPQSNHPFRHPFQPVMLSLGASPPAAPVPSDEEIDSAIDAVRRHRLNPEDAFIEAYHALRKLAKRIGVKL